MTTLTQSTDTTRQKWLDQLYTIFSRYKAAGWDFIFLLRDGIDELPRTTDERMRLYEDASSITGQAVKTLQNYVSAARKPCADLAKDLDLEIGHLLGGKF